MLYMSEKNEFEFFFLTIWFQRVGKTNGFLVRQKKIVIIFNLVCDIDLIDNNPTIATATMRIFGSFKKTNTYKCGYLYSESTVEL